MIHYPITLEVKIAGKVYEVDFSLDGPGDLLIFVPGSEEMEEGEPTWSIPNGSTMLRDIIHNECATAEPEYDPDDIDGYSWSVGVDDGDFVDEVRDRIDGFVASVFDQKVPVKKAKLVELHPTLNNQAA